MGTVGLSFGSPTSGTGFNVSATVSQIVANLENVETPWKTQLSSLESQDTVLSNLGTLLSNLSNDVGQLTDFSGIMAQKTGSSSDTNVLELTSASSAAVAGTHTVVVNSLATTSSGYLTALPSASATLTGSITLQVGNGAAQTITLDSSDNTLAGLAAAINSSGIGINASVLTDASGSRLSLVSGTSGANGNISITQNSLAAASSAALSFTAGSSSSGTLTGIPSAGDTLSGAITIQVGSNAPQTINVDAGDGDNTLTSLMNAINNAGLGVTASIVTNSDGTQSLSMTTGTGGPALSVTPSLTDTSTPLAYTQTVAGENASLDVDGVSLTSASNTVTNLIPGVTFQLLAPSAEESDGSLEQVQVVIGNDNSGVESAVNQMVSDYNSLISAVDAQQGNDSSGNAEPLFGSPTLMLLQQQLLSSLNQQNPNGSLDAIAANAGTTLSGSITIQVGGGSAQTVEVPTGDNSLQGLANAINAANIGVTAGITTQNGQSTLSLMSQTAGSAGNLTVTSNLLATTNQTSTALNYTNSSDISTLANLGITISDKDDGSLSFDVNTLDSALDTDYSGVLGFFQNVDSWGQSFASMLENAGSSSPAGIVKLAQNSNSSTESTLNAEISKEDAMISAEQKSLTEELTSANEVMQALPSQLQGVNELYSAITGYNQNGNG